MPLKSCEINGQNGYKWGNQGKCYVFIPGDKNSEDKAKHQAITQGIAEHANGAKFAKLKVSFDYDGVLSTKKGKVLAKNEINNGNEVYIITARMKYSDNSDLYSIADNIGIKKEYIYFTNHHDKWEKIKELKINKHFDNNYKQIQDINKYTDAKGILVN